VNTIVHCPRGRACSEVTCVQRRWCRKMLERGLSNGGLEAQISAEVWRQDESGSAVHHESGAGKKALPVSRRAIDRAED
jgi:hypothetical protein